MAKHLLVHEQLLQYAYVITNDGIVRNLNLNTGNHGTALRL